MSRMGSIFMMRKKWVDARRYQHDWDNWRRKPTEKKAGKDVPITPPKRNLVLETLAGAVEMAAQSETSLEDLRNSVMSKKGTTEAGIHALRRDGLLEQLLVETTEAAYARACELRARMLARAPRPPAAPRHATAVSARGSVRPSKAGR